MLTDGVYTHITESLLPPTTACMPDFPRLDSFSLLPLFKVDKLSIQADLFLQLNFLR